jgi:hypothetical protein
LTDVSEVLTAAIITSETLVNFYETTRRNIPEDSHLYTRRRENLISHWVTVKSMIDDKSIRNSMGVEIQESTYFALCVVIFKQFEEHRLCLPHSFAADIVGCNF